MNIKCHRVLIVLLFFDLRHILGVVNDNKNKHLKKKRKKIWIGGRGNAWSCPQAPVFKYGDG